MDPLPSRAPTLNSSPIADGIERRKKTVLTSISMVLFLYPYKYLIYIYIYDKCMSGEAHACSIIICCVAI
jgi:hypothetical protein